MTLTLAHTVEIGEIDNKTDFTSRVLGFDVHQFARPQRVNPNRVIITLDNNDGALTPNAGGTYDSVDWFAQGVFIETTVNGGTSQPVFHGIVDDFALADTGTNSTVQIIALDWVAVVGRLSPADYSSSPAIGPGDGISSTLSKKLSGPDDMAKLGATGALKGSGNYANDNLNVRMRLNTTDDQFITDALQNDIMAADMCVLYGGKITHDPAPLDLAVYWPVIIGNTLTRAATTYTPDTLNTFVFTGTTPASGQLPISETEAGYNIEELINTVYSTRDGGTTQTVQNTASADKYGARTYVSYGNAAETDTNALNGATNIVNRLSTSRFTAQQIRFDSALLDSTPAGSATQLEQLLHIETGLWQPCTVTYTPTGAASSITDTNVIYGRRIRATASGTSFVLDLLPAADYQSFVLNSTALGVLDQNRLG